MMLLRKELGALRFWWLFILLLEVIGFGMTAMTSFIDSDPLSPEDHQKNASSILVFTIVIGFGSVATAFGHERDQDTQRFLDALPVSQARAFFTKLLASYLTVMGWHIIDLGTSVISGMLSLTSVSLPLPWQYLGGMLVVSAVHGLAVVGVGSVLAFARRWYASFVGLLVWFAVKRGLGKLKSGVEQLFGSIYGAELMIPLDVATRAKFGEPMVGLALLCVHLGIPLGRETAEKIARSVSGERGRILSDRISRIWPRAMAAEGDVAREAALKSEVEALVRTLSGD